MDFVKIINPCTCSVIENVGVTSIVKGYVKITYKKGRLSLTGVIGPTRGGNCKGSCGQCLEEIREGEPTEKWTREMLDRLCDIWDAWHLNDMRPYCTHMKQLGWVEQSKERVKVVKWGRKKETWDKIKAAEARAIECLKKGKTFVPTPEETMYANIGYEITTYNDELPEHPEFYEFKEKDCLGHSNVEYKTRGWISYSDHPLGFLGRPCPICGYKYGHEWQKEEVPQEVIDWLIQLPNTETKPAWI